MRKVALMDKINDLIFYMINKLNINTILEPINNTSSNWSRVPFHLKKLFLYLIILFLQRKMINCF